MGPLAFGPDPGARQRPNLPTPHQVMQPIFEEVTHEKAGSLDSVTYPNPGLSHGPQGEHESTT